MPDSRALPPCSELRSKKWFFLTAPARSAADLLDASNACWCARTSTALGPDGEPVDPDDCVEGRACWRASAAARLPQA